jgi:Na+/H+-dicarboxylate symporter
MSTSKLTRNILIALVIGLLVGFVINQSVSDETAREAARYLGIVTQIFLRLIKMIIAPLVLSTLVVGVAHMGSGGAIGKTFARTLAWFIVASVASLSLGILMVNLLQPGVGVGLALPDAAASTGLAKAAFDPTTFFPGLVPKSIFEAMATNEILQIVVFSLFAGLGLIAIGEQGAPITRGLEALMHLMLKITSYVMQFAPYAVFAAVAAAIAVEGLAILVTFGKFIGSFYLGLAMLWVLLLSAGAFVIGPGNVKRLVGTIREPFLITFATASSEAAYPKMIEALDRFGVPTRITSFVLPLGYSFNLDGSMMYCAFASIFIAQAYGIELTLAQEIFMLGLLMITSKGIAGVPRASLVVIAATLPYFGIPEAGLLLILAVDHFLDMGRSATNVIGNAVATAVIAKWDEGDVAKTAAVAAAVGVEAAAE